MSEHMKGHHTKKRHGGTTHIHNNTMLYVLANDIAYAIPKKVAEKYIVDFAPAIEGTTSVSPEAVFSELDKKHTKSGALLRGLRIREGLSQVEFAKIIGVTQANLSKMENGKRPIGKIIAKRIEENFQVNYRYFLE